MKSNSELIWYTYSDCEDNNFNMIYKYRRHHRNKKLDNNKIQYKLRFHKMQIQSLS